MLCLTKGKQIYAMKNWYCVYTKPAQEDAVARKLSELLGLEVFNPKIKTKKFSRAKLVESIEGLFPCYFFTRFDHTKYIHTITYTRGVKRFVGDAAGIPYVVDDAIIESIQARLKEGFVALNSTRFVGGERVLVEEGPFSGLSGLFINDLRPNERVLILLDAIRYQATLEINREMVARAL